MHVDHIEPLSKNWDRRLDPTNVQIMCDDCNLGKGNRDSIDWRALE
jgi:5-methylcytosine-specific restriction endonuclease McrA